MLFLALTLPALAMAQISIPLVSTTAAGCAAFGTKDSEVIPYDNCLASPMLSSAYGQGATFYLKASTPASSTSSVTVNAYTNSACSGTAAATVTIPTQGTYIPPAFAPVPYVPTSNTADLLVGAFSDASIVIITTCGASSGTTTGGTTTGGTTTGGTTTGGTTTGGTTTGGTTTGGTTTGTTSPSTCDACVSGNYLWCNGACYTGTYASSATCRASYSSCYTQFSYFCSTLSSCSSTGGSSTGGSSYYPSSATLGNVGLTIDDVDDAKKAVAAGVAASVVVGFVFALLIIYTSCCCARTPPPSATGQLWKARAATAATTISVGVFFQALGLVTGLAAPAIPWLSIGATLSKDLTTFGFGANYVFSATTLTYTDFTGTKVSASLGVLAGGAIIAYIGLIGFLFPALLMAWSALYRLNTVSKFGGGPVTPIGCCLPSLPAIQGLSWAGMIVFLVGAAWDWTLFGLIRIALLGGGVGPGGSLMAASFACLFVAALCYSVAGCCQLGNFPGVGTARANCCGPEKDENAIPAEATSPAPGLKLQGVNVGSAV